MQTIGLRWEVRDFIGIIASLSAVGSAIDDLSARRTFSRSRWLRQDISLSVSAGRYDLCFLYWLRVNAGLFSHIGCVNQNGSRDGGR